MVITHTPLKIVMMSLINGFSVVASEGASLIKISFYASIMLFISGIGILVIPPLVNTVL